MSSQNSFKLPIEYLKDKIKLDDQLKIDFDYKNIYNILFKTKDRYTEKVKDNWGKYYTNNKHYLKSTQKIIKTMDISLNNTIIEDAYNIINDFDNEDNFLNKYNYININLLKQFNQNIHVLQGISTYKLMSPILSLMLPILVLIFPFILMKLRGIDISVENYIQLLKNIVSKYSIGKLFTDFSSQNLTKKVYIVFSAFFYLFQIYQNCKTCLLFYNYIRKFKEYITKIQRFILHIDNTMNIFISKYQKLKGYRKFIKSLLIQRENIKIFNIEIENIDISDDNKINLSTITKIGLLMKSFYNIYLKKENVDMFEFLFKWCGFIKNMNDIKLLHIDKTINNAKFNTKKTELCNFYFPPLLLLEKQAKIVTNNVNLNNNFIITGPNASGKTTIIKGIGINILLSQQIGFGFYDSASVYLYDRIHSYINIPDTSGRDSLFQAEVKRCNKIISDINKYKRHLCILDELYSGTNISEAIACGYSFIEYLNRNKNVNMVLTTHYYKLCGLVENNNKNSERKKVLNKGMDVVDNNYTYKLKNGITNIKGGIQVLKKISYPNEIVKNALKIMNDLYEI